MKKNKFKAYHKTKKKWLKSEELVFQNGEWFEDWREFEDGIPLKENEIAILHYTELDDEESNEIYSGHILYCKALSDYFYVNYQNGMYVMENSITEIPLIDYHDESIIVGNIFEKSIILEEVK